MIPGVRHRATRRRPTGTVAFDNSLVVEGAATTNVNLTVAAGATIIVFAAGNVTTAARVDGVAMTLIGQTSNAAMYAATGLAAGARNIQVDRSGSSSYIVAAASYTGATAVAGGALGSGSSTTPSGTPAGSGSRAVVGFDIGVASGDMPSVVSNGSIRQLYRRTSGNVLAIADRTAAPVTLTNPTGGSWTTIAAWLNA
ncbi:minor tail protein [Gordonia phage Stultus]|uniref:Minor tail protein n=2 Tax=Vividuovirus TaxID=2560251 RepID=A0A3G3M901_9CAUD|nr:minor tail protein [Gordonia phage Geodirt]YP_010099538.1 minor tail protein [Gordonia phage Stultus]AYR02933.1 hypothetical protein SEA_GEODIRT_39 [Gordonia phage Geodirt]AYR03509.1 hypothetical protein SEA_STULTUS_39 [Gordonia phage Stultus]